MNESTNPLPLPEQTLPQPTAGPTVQGTVDSTPPLATMNMDATGTMAAPQGYNPSAIAASTKGAAEEHKSVAFAVKAGSMAGRYEVQRALAKGGMGQVSIARDTELERDIALKEIQPKFKMDEATLHRFLLEARVTGRLEHPGIVPVYGLGTYPDGRPYYAMRFITGSSFQDAINEFHDREIPTRDPQERSLALRQLLRRFVDVCNTIGYAHSRGVLHRDIKPANVMLGHYGETLVVDWGLAKEMAAPAQLPVVAISEVQETREIRPADAKDFEETLEGFTLHGQTMGTPAYMSPEQAAGRWDVTAIASDVYSLGAMLYALLSGSPPYSGPSYEVITRVQRGDYKPVKLVKGSTPSPLDAICRKAMAFDIKDRYSSALVLAADVERWLADEPVSCYREPFRIRAARWARRHRTAVTSAAALLLTGILALSIGLVLVNRERKEKEKAYFAAAESRDETKAALTLATESRGETRDALLSLTEDALGEILAASGEPTPEQAKFLDGVIGMYRKFAEKEADSPDTRLFTAKAHYRIGRIEARLQRYPNALVAYAEAAKLLADPSIAGLNEARGTRGEVQLYTGIVALQTNKLPEAEAEFLEAIQTYRDLIAKDPKPAYSARLSQCLDRLGVLYVIQQRDGDAERLVLESLGIRMKLSSDSPNDAEYQSRVAQSYRQLADICFRTNRIAEGRDAAAKSLATLNKLAADHPTSVAYLRLLADMETVMAAHYTVPRSPLEAADPKLPPKEGPALAHARGAVATWGKLVALNPGDKLLRQRLAEANCNLARQCQDHNRPREAITALNAAATILKEINAKDPNNAVTQLKLAQTLLGLASVYREIIDKNAAGAADEAVAFADALALKLPSNAEAAKYAALAHIERSGVRLGKSGVKETKADPIGAKADLDAAWPYVQAAGDAEAAQRSGRAMADWMDDVDDFKAVEPTGMAMASLKLPNGMAQYVAACFHSRVVKLLLESPEVDTERVALANKQRGWAVKHLRDAVTAGFDRVDLLETEPDLVQVRPTNEFAEILEGLRSKNPPKRKDN